MVHGAQSALVFLLGWGIFIFRNFFFFLGGGIWGMVDVKWPPGSVTVFVCMYMYIYVYVFVINLNKSINGVRWVCGWINWTSEVLNIQPEQRASAAPASLTRLGMSALGTVCPRMVQPLATWTVRWIYAESILNTWQSWIESIEQNHCENVSSCSQG